MFQKLHAVKPNLKNIKDDSQFINTLKIYMYFKYDYAIYILNNGVLVFSKKETIMIH